ncbi:hypothetical protein GE300_01080 [Rhodobacteraceae bacterium 2CG4]|uniref:Flp pilus assembly pilin Flp n=1 Tax=Halovulum marinum TaxID=2662447 RepID=A0A6L5YVB8_9RHOB|nr:hypothetical protein [Halovulum marinum]MSU88207.1 hypothetical protein [Halovulum marinum]
MLGQLRIFRRDDSGAVTVDWVVLTAAIVGLNIIAIMSMIKDGLRDNGDYINGKIDEARADMSR